MDAVTGFFDYADDAEAVTGFFDHAGDWRIEMVYGVDWRAGLWGLWFRWPGQLVSMRSVTPSLFTSSSKYLRPVLPGPIFALILYRPTGSE